MKTIYRILASAALLMALTACTDELFDGKGKLPPGVEVDLEMGVSIPQPLEADVISSRAMADAEINRQVHDFCLFIFDENDNLLNRYYFPSVLDTPTLCDPDFSTGATATLRREGTGRAVLNGIHTSTGTRRIMGIGNVNRKGASMLLDDMKEVKTATDLRNVIGGADNTDSNIFVMSGNYEASDGSSTDGRFNLNTASLGGVIRLVPMMSRIRFIVDGNGLKGEGDIPDGRFKLENWQVLNLPAEAPLWSTGEHTERPTFNSVVREQFTQQLDNDPNKTGFAFFSLENNPAPKDGADISTYGERSAWTGDGATDPDKKSYTNAPSTATAVVIRGTYTGASYITPEKGAEKEIHNVIARVTYTIFLGHDSANDFNDFRTLRGYNYTYKIKIGGVNEISVEVLSEIENRPDGEGHLIVSDSETQQLDAHYCQRTISISAAALRRAINTSTFGARSVVPPLGISREYLYVNNTDEYTEPEPAPEFNWIEAYVHKADDPDYVSYTKARGSASKKATLTVPQLLVELHKFAKSDAADSDEIKLTLFFDEYLYETDEWKSVANSQVRTFSLIGNPKFSADHNSSYTTGGLTFQQLPIRTFYEISNPDLKRAWGVESIEEPIRASGTTLMRENANGGTGVPGGSSKYGRQNFWRQIYDGVNHAGDRPWDHYIDANGYLKEGSKNEMVAACLLRNRDLNGNGKIDAEEVRWYTPSIEQLTQMYVCRNVIPAEARLYNPQLEMQNFTGMKYNYKHYVSSSGLILWAEEGGSTGPFQVPWRNGDFYVRCVRDLGTYLGTGNDDVPYWISQDRHSNAQFETVVKGYQADHGTDHVAGRISLERLNSSALRLGMELVDIPGNVTTFTASTAPARQFEWADSIINTVNPVSCTTDNAKASSVPQGITECHRAFGPGWRLPTLSELIVIWWYVGTDELKKMTKGSTLLTRTKYYYLDLGYASPSGSIPRNHVFDDTGGGVPQFTLISNQNQSKENGRMLCVRDYIEGVE